jgi:sec-independent protein translocase protein TatA
MDLGLPELLIILLIVLLLFGGARLPQLARSIGQSLKELREGFESKGPISEDKKTENEKKV